LRCGISAIVRGCSKFWQTFAKLSQNFVLRNFVSMYLCIGNNVIIVSLCRIISLAGAETGATSKCIHFCILRFTYAEEKRSEPEPQQNDAAPQHWYCDALWLQVTSIIFIFITRFNSYMKRIQITDFNLHSFSRFLHVL
jgi:hypothetical protein